MQQINEKYFRYLESCEKRPITIKSAKNMLLRFETFITKDLKSVTQDDIVDWNLYLKKEKLTTQTRSNYMQQISTFFDYLIENGYYTAKNPCKNTLTGLSKAPHNRIRNTTILSVEEVKRIVLKASNPRDRAIVLTYYKTGMRLTELTQLQKSNINLDTKTITIPERKGGKTGQVFFDEEASRWIKVLFSLPLSKEKNAFGISHRRIAEIVKDVGLKAGFENLRPHDFRHAFTTHLSGNRCHPEIIRELRGDSNRDMVSYYTHFTPAQVREEYERSIPKLGV